MSKIQIQRIRRDSYKSNYVKKEKFKEHNTKPTIDRDNLDFCLVRDNPGDLTCHDICPSSFHLKCIGMKKKDDVGTSKDIETNPHDVASCQLYDKECETTSIPEHNNVNQDERIRLNELRENQKIHQIISLIL